MNLLLKRLWTSFAIIVILFALVFSLFRGLTPWVGQYRPEIEQRLSRLLGEKVHIGAMTTGWYWFEPIIKLTNIELLGDAQQPVRLGQLFVGLDLGSSLWHWRWQPGVLVIEDLQIVLKQSKHGWEVQGLSPARSGMGADNPQQLQWITQWLLAQQQLRLRNVTIRLNLLDGTVLPLDDVALSIQNQNDRYSIKGRASMPQATDTQFSLQGYLDIDDANFNSATGKLHVNVENLMPGQWQSLFSPEHLQIVSGVVSGQFWINVDQGHFTQGHTLLAIQNLIIEHAKKNKQVFLQSLTTSMSWKYAKNVFHVFADTVTMRLDSVQWPENQISFEYDTKLHAADLKLRYADASIFHAISALSAEEPLLFNNTVLSGGIHKLHAQWSHNSLQSLFAKFERLSWRGDKTLPNMSGLSGAVFIKDKVGSLRLDSKEVLLQSLHKPALIINTLALDVAWIQASNYIQNLTINEFSLQHPHLEINAHGSVSKKAFDRAPDIDIHGQTTLTKAEYWKPWLPEHKIKPKIYDWLNEDIKSVPRVTGRFDVQGNWEDFPFDSSLGQFRIEIIGEDVDLALAPNWPVAHSLKGALTINKDHLSATIYHGWLGDILLKSLNIELSKLGSDKEILTLHTRINTAVQKLIDYIQHTPLQQRLGFLQKIKTTGDAIIDLQLEIPFEQSPEDIIVLGELQLLNAALTVGFDGLPLGFSKIKGSIQFDQKGIMDSALDMNFLQLPMEVRMQSNFFPKPALSIDADLPINVEALKQQWPSAWWQLIEGETQAHAKMLITEDINDLDRLHVVSKLKGLKLNLPPPFKKNTSAESNMELTVDFNPKQGFYLKTQWENLLATHLWFSMDEGAIHLQKGEVRLGTAHASPDVSQGVQLIGHLPQFDDRQWQTISEIAMQQAKQPSVLSNINFVDVIIDKVHWFGQSMSQVSIKAKQINNRWDIYLKERVIQAKLQWDHVKNAIGIHLNRLSLPSTHHQRSSTHWPTLQPQDFPAVNLTVERLFSRNIELGKLNLNGRPDKQRWVLERLHLDNDDYQLRAKGDWYKQNSIDKSRIEMGLTIHKLSSLLKRFKYPEMVQAHGGFVSFQGQWLGAIYNPKENSVSGELTLDFKHGVINELSKDTQEKIGLGKMLSIFSLQTIPRRLRLDFSDLSNKGYSFDSIKGTFALKKAMLTTKKAVINGPVARVAMEGTINTNNAQCNLRVRVMPHITASLPVVATLAGGPVAGVAVWLVNKIISHGMEKVTSYTYLVTGPLAQPNITQGTITKAQRG